MGPARGGEEHPGVKLHRREVAGTHMGGVVTRVEDGDRICLWGRRRVAGSMECKAHIRMPGAEVLWAKACNVGVGVIARGCCLHGRRGARGQGEGCAYSTSCSAV